MRSHILSLRGDHLVPIHVLLCTERIKIVSELIDHYAPVLILEPVQLDQAVETCRLASNLKRNNCKPTMGNALCFTEIRCTAEYPASA